MQAKPLPGKQQGISLIVTLLITVLMSLLALYGAGVLVLDTRSAANDYRYREALAAAESGIEQGFSLINANRANIAAIGAAAWADCTATTPACLPIRADQSPVQPGDRTTWRFMQVSPGLTTQPSAGGSFNLFLLTPASGEASGLLFNIVAIGSSADGSSTATVKQGVYFYPLVLGNVETPLASASNVPLSGNYSIITNPNGGGSGVPVSVWTDDAVTVSGNGSYATCQPGDFTGGACPSAAALSKKGQYGPDLVQDSNFPPDLFQFLFGVPATDYAQIKAQATVLGNCSSLNAASSGFYWITGDCNPPGNVGTVNGPVLVVVEGGTTINAGDQFYGLLYMFNPAGGLPSLKANGNATLHGAILAHSGVDLQLNGGFVLEYNKNVLSNLKRNPSSRALAKIPGSWSDVQ